MQSIVGLPAVTPLSHINWSPKVIQDIYKSWAAYYTRRRREITAQHYYDNALALDPHDFMTRYYRSQSNRKMAKPDVALTDSRVAAELATLMRNGEQSAPINLEICNALYDLNQFEDSLVETANNKRYFIGNKTKIFEKLLVVLSENINDCVGDSLGPFIMANDKIMQRVMALNKERERIETRPLWKVMKADGKCDVLSILEEEVKLLTPLEIARRRRSFNLFNQNYLDRSWVDILFLEHLNKHPGLCLEQAFKSSEYLQNLLRTQGDVLKKFRKMMQARSPMYYLRANKISDLNRLWRYQEAFLYRIQYQTRRNMITVLRTIRQLRKDRNLKKLTLYVEDVMGNYFSLKTIRIMPWRYEFINEVYNTLGLAYTEQYRVPPSFLSMQQCSLKNLLLLHSNKSSEYTAFKFGDRSTYETIDATSVQNAKKHLANLEYRLVTSKFSIARCYLLHQIGHAHFKQNHFDETCFYARKAIEETKNCNSYLWRFLSYILMCKSYATLYKVERGREVLTAALDIAKTLKSPNLVQFVETCLMCNEQVSITKKRSLSSNAPSITSTQTISL